MRKSIFALFFVLIYSSAVISGPEMYFKIRIIDAETGRGIPLVELRTLNHITYFTDSNGLIAFFEPGLMNESVFIKIHGQGYDYPQDSFGSRGLAINTIPGDSITIELNRTIVAERLYRVTGAGIYRDSYLLGESMPLKMPLKNSRVMGQDSNAGIIYKGKIFWIWGDTYKMSFPLGNFSVSGATSELPQNGGLPPEKGIDLNYFVDDDGFSKRMIDIPGKGFVWLGWLATARNDAGETKLLTDYARVKLNFQNHERGIAVYNDETEMFEKYRPVDEWIDEYHSMNHPFLGSDGKEDYYYFTTEFRFRRVAPHLDSMATASAYQAYTCLQPGASYNALSPALDRDKDGKLIWGWKNGADPIDADQHQALIDSRHISKEEGWHHITDIATGQALSKISRGSIFWNEFRQRWILITGGSIGTVWYGESDSPTGPWHYLRKIAEHDKNYYNVVHHPFFDQENGRVIYFEGTYTNSFVPDKNITPRYEYNQLMYRLSLDHPQIYLPVAVYQYRAQNGNASLGPREMLVNDNAMDQRPSVAFLAYQADRALPGMIPIYQTAENDQPRLSLEASGEAVFYALPAEEAPFEKLIGNWQCRITDQIFLERNINLVMAAEEEVAALTADIQTAAYQVKSFTNRQDSLFLTVQYFDEVIDIQAHIEGDRLSGKWQASDGSVTGIIEGRQTDYRRFPFQLKSLTNLYQHKSPAGEYVYSINAAQGDGNFNDSKPICRVWKYPGGSFQFAPPIHQVRLNN